MLFYIFLIFVLGPIIEWCAHYFLHITRNKLHYVHHENVTKNIINKDFKITVEIWPLIAIFICLYNTFFSGAYLFLRYYIIHTIIHFYPNIFPKLTNHHMLHHKYSKYNYCITNTWPDKLFGTLYINKNN